MKTRKRKQAVERKASRNQTNSFGAKSEQSLEQTFAQVLGANDLASRDQMYAELCRDHKIMNFPTISIAQLASLVQGRMRGNLGKGRIDADMVAAEIESTLDLVEMCQQRLLARQRKWKSKVASSSEIEGLSHAETHKSEWLNALDQNETKLIRAKKFPMSFVRGLGYFHRGMLASESKDRKRRFAKFFATTFCEWNWSFAPPGAQRLFSTFGLVPQAHDSFAASKREAIELPTHDEISVYMLSHDIPIKHEDVLSWIGTKQKWPDADSLLWVKLKWIEWLPREEQINKSAGGSAPKKKRR